MKAFVAGATGLTGRFVVQALCDRNVAVTAHVRSDSPRLSEWRAHFESLGAQVDATPWTPGDMIERFSSNVPDLVFATLGTTKKREKRGDGDYLTVDYGLTAMLIDALKPLQSTRVVYLSSYGVKAGSKSAYLNARWITEEHLRQSGLPFLIARPSFILGKRDEKRWMESVGGGVSDALLGTLGFLGAKRTARRFGSIQGEELGQGLVREALRWPQDNRLVHSEDLRADFVPNQEE